GKQAGQSINDGITKGAKGAGKSVGDAIIEGATRGGEEAGKAAGDALEKGVSEGAKRAGKSAGDELDRSIGESAKRTGKSAGDSIGGMVLDSVREGARQAGYSLEDLMQASAKKAGAAIGKALGDLPGVRDVVQAIGIDGDQAADAISGIGTAITGIKQKDLAGTLGGISQALTGIGQTDAGNVLGAIGEAAGAAQKQFAPLAEGISAGGKALGIFSANSSGIAGRIGTIGAAAAAAAPEVAALTAAILAAEQEGDKLNKQHFHNKQVFPSEGIPGSAQWLWNKGKRLVGGENPWDVFTTGPGGPGAGAPAPAPTPGPGSSVQGPYTVAPGIPQGPADYKSWYGSNAPALQTLLPPFPGGGAKAAPSGNASGPGVPLVQTASGTWTSPNPAWAHLIQRESSGRNIGQQITDANGGPGSPNAAQGLFQITPATWAAHGGTQFAPNPLAATPQQQAQIAAKILQGNPSGSDWGAGLPGRENAAALLAGITPTGFDDGGQLLPGMQLVNNASGQPEIVLTQDQAKNAMQGMPGMGAGPSDTPLASGQSPGENGAAALTDLLGQKPDESPLGALGAPGGKDQRTQGYIPAGAGGKGTAGTSLWSGSLQLGAQAINGLIEQAGSAAATAISAAATAGSFGAGGQAAGPASSFLIGIGTKMAERAVSYGFQMGGIAGDALAEILSPFGVPRLFQTDPSQFMPQLPGRPAATTTGEKAQQHQDNPAAANDPNINPSGPVQPEQMPGQQVIGPSAPVATPGTGNYKPEAPPVGPGLSPGPAAPSLAPTQPVGPQAPQSGPLAGPQPQQPPVQPPKPPLLLPTDLGGLLGAQSYDTGGWLMPQGIAINQTSRPEPILNPQQFDNLQAIASQGMPMPDPAAVGGRNDYSVNIENVTVSDVEAMRREIDSRQRLQMMRYSARP
ncbi:transglycosylase family protein, partial [Mycobacterium intracellulare]|uniref:transglycosylase family protein n=1 Tax=Mycobacterium intracellulare TaxID=1767 RepID=UPI000CE36276